MTLHIAPITDAAQLGADDVVALLALEADTQDRPLALPTLLAEAGSHGTVLLARRDGAIVGFASARLQVDEAHVIRLAVDAGERRRGTGRVLLDGLVGWAREVGAEAVLLEVRADNVAARALYAGAGFTQDGLRPRYYPDGEDARLLRLPLVAGSATDSATDVPADVPADVSTDVSTGSPAGGV